MNRADEEDQSGPLHLFLQHLDDVHPGDGQEHHGTDQGRHGGLHVQGPVDNEQEDGEGQGNQSHDHQFLVGDAVLFLQILDSAVHILDVGLLDSSSCATRGSKPP